MLFNNITKILDLFFSLSIVFIKKTLNMMPVKNDIGLHSILLVCVYLFPVFSGYIGIYAYPTIILISVFGVMLNSSLLKNVWSGYRYASKIKILYLILILVGVYNIICPELLADKLKFNIFGSYLYQPEWVSVIGPFLCTGLILEVLVCQNKNQYMSNLGYGLSTDGIFLPLLVTSFYGVYISKGLLPIILVLNVLSVTFLLFLPPTLRLKNPAIEYSALLPLCFIIDIFGSGFFLEVGWISLGLAIAGMLEYRYGKLVYRWSFTISYVIFGASFVYFCSFLVSRLSTGESITLGLILSGFHWIYAEVPRVKVTEEGIKTKLALATLKLINFMLLKPYQGYVYLSLFVAPVYSLSLGSSILDLTLDSILIRLCFSGLIGLFLGSEWVCNQCLNYLDQSKVEGPLNKLYYNPGKVPSTELIKGLTLAGLAGLGSYGVQDCLLSNQATEAIIKNSQEQDRIMASTLSHAKKEKASALAAKMAQEKLLLINEAKKSNIEQNPFLRFLLPTPAETALPKESPQIILEHSTEDVKGNKTRTRGSF